MLERGEGFGFIVWCDCCPAFDQEFDVDTHEELRAALKAAGWDARVVSGKLLHKCPACSEEGKPW